MGPEPVVALRALEHHTYCERQCALIHGDGVWADNRHTIRGVHHHRRVDSGRSTSERSVRVLRAIPLWSERYGLTGRADVVELHQDGAVVPVEHKAGSRHGRAADLQLCAQAVCLEEMLHVQLSHGYVWYGGPRRRSRVVFDDRLRSLTLAAIDAIRANLVSDRLPAAPNDVRCSACQLFHHCLPGVVALTSGRLRYSTDLELYQCDT